MFFERIHNIFNWGDKLTRYNGETITYDEIGNPLSYRDGMEMTWLNGRKLTTLQSGNDSISYKYDSNGVITSKTVNGVEYTYEYLNGHLMHETRGEKVFDYCYDANGQLYAVSYKANSSTNAVTYYYAHNWRGDITSIYDGDGNMVAKYEYDAWGNVRTVTNSNNSEITDPNHIANLNPFRYRSYYYDSESGFYYLMSRYYDPVTHRFLNADGYFQSGDNILDTNMNAYCRNNPIVNYDSDGRIVLSTLIIGAVVGGLISGGIEIAGQAMSGKKIDEIDWWSVGIETITGAALGALPGLNMSVGAVALAKGTIGTLNAMAHSINNGDNFGTITLKTATAALTSFTIASVKPATYKLTDTYKPKHLVPSQASNTASKIHEWSQKVTIYDGATTKLTKKVVVNSSIKANAPVLTCRGCGRPIGKQYSWQCRSGWTY